MTKPTPFINQLEIWNPGSSFPPEAMLPISTPSRNTTAIMTAGRVATASETLSSPLSKMGSKEVKID